MMPLQDGRKGSCFVLDYAEDKYTGGINSNRLRPFHQLTTVEQSAMIDLHLLAKELDGRVYKIITSLWRVRMSRCAEICTAFGDAVSELQAEIAKLAAHENIPNMLASCVDRADDIN